MNVERMLSPRLLHFSTNQILWDCATLSASEVFPKGLPEPLDHHVPSTDRHWRERLQTTATINIATSPPPSTSNSQPSSSPSFFAGAAAADSLDAFWASAVRSYTACQLTFGRDKAIAVWGVAKVVRDAWGGDEAYAEGMWERKLEEQLAWRVVDRTWARRGVVAVEGRADNVVERRAPSWTWVGLDDAVIVVGDRMPGTRCYTVRHHDGGKVRFVVEEWGRERKKAEAFEDWKSQFGAWDRRLASVVGRKEKQIAGFGRLGGIEEERKEQAAKEKFRRDEHPKLKEKVLKLYGYVGRGMLTADERRLRILMGQENDNTIEVFLDTPQGPGNNPVYFMVLAASEMVPTADPVLWDSDTDKGTHDKIDSETDEGAADEDCQRMRGDAEGHRGNQGVQRTTEKIQQRYKGVGIVLEPEQRKNHFSRCGSFRFTGMSRQVFDAIQHKEDSEVLGNFDEEGKYQIWLW